MKLNNETKIGILVAFVIISLGYLTFKAGNFKVRKKGYELKAHFITIDGVDVNAPVRLNGMEVGLVKKIRVRYGEDDKMELTLWINEGTKIHEGSKVFVKNMGLFGEKYVGLTIGEPEKPYLQPGTVLEGTEPVDFEKVMADAEKLVDNLKAVSAEVRERLEVNRENIDVTMEKMRIASSNIADISSNVKERLDVNSRLIDEMFVSLNSASKNFDEMSYDLKLNPWKLMYKKIDRSDESRLKESRREEKMKKREK